MKASIAREFEASRPQAIVLDDNPRSRDIIAIELKSRGFDVAKCSTVDQFEDAWKPGMYDVIIADWQLSAEHHGDEVLASVRLRDWDVPFVLISGKLHEDASRSPVLAGLLEHGASRFIERGNGAIEHACDVAEELIEKRDIGLLRVILTIRPLARRDQTITTSSGSTTFAEQLAVIVSAPAESHIAARPVARRRAEKSPIVRRANAAARSRRKKS